MSRIDWSRATVVIRAPVVHTASEDIQEFEVPLAYLIPSEAGRQAVTTRVGGSASMGRYASGRVPEELISQQEAEELCHELGHLYLPSMTVCVRCGEERKD